MRTCSQDLFFFKNTITSRVPWLVLQLVIPRSHWVAWIVWHHCNKNIPPAWSQCCLAHLSPTLPRHCCNSTSFFLWKDLILRHRKAPTPGREEGRQGIESKWQLWRSCIWPKYQVTHDGKVSSCSKFLLSKEKEKKIPSHSAMLVKREEGRVRIS